MATVRYGTRIDTAILFHGSAVSGIKRFEPEIEKFSRPGNDTLGIGIYFTASEQLAELYARRRSAQFRTIGPTVYRAVLREASMVDLRDSGARAEVLVDFIQFVSQLIRSDAHTRMHFGAFEELAELHFKGSLAMQNRIKNILRGIIRSYESNKKPSNIREVLDPGYSIGSGYFSLYLKALGNHGLISPEGNDLNLPPSETWMIFEHYPNLQILDEKIISNPPTTNTLNG